MRATKPRLPTHYEAQWLRRIAQSALMLTQVPDQPDRYSLQSGATVPVDTALALIRNGWVKAERDGLFDAPQTWHALTP